MTCPQCTDEDGESCYPTYGVGPHVHSGNSMISATVALPKEQWPENYSEDPDCPGLGTWWCSACGDGKPEAQSAAAIREGGQP